jgi:hypothetical protein
MRLAGYDLSPPLARIKKKAARWAAFFYSGEEKQAACAACAGDSKAKTCTFLPLRIAQLLALRASVARRGRAVVSSFQAVGSSKSAKPALTYRIRIQIDSGANLGLKLKSDDAGLGRLH